MKATSNRPVEGPIYVSGNKFPNIRRYAGEVSWFCEAANGAKVVVTAPGTAKRTDIENYLASGPEMSN